MTFSQAHVFRPGNGELWRPANLFGFTHFLKHFYDRKASCRKLIRREGALTPSKDSTGISEWVSNENGASPWVPDFTVDTVQLTRHPPLGLFYSHTPWVTVNPSSHKNAPLILQNFFSATNKKSGHFRLEKLQVTFFTHRPLNSTSWNMQSFYRKTISE